MIKHIQIKDYKCLHDKYPYFPYIYPDLRLSNSL